MHINIEQNPPANIPQLRWKYTRASLFFLALVIGAVITGAAAIFFNTGHDEVLQNSAFGLFVAAGFAFVYYSEKLLGYRKLSSKQQEKLVELAQHHEAVSEYWRQVAEQGRYIVVAEYDAAVAYAQQKSGSKI